eukprot:766419-Hanusia_phi.AAC.1
MLSSTSAAGETVLSGRLGMRLCLLLACTCTLHSPRFLLVPPSRDVLPKVGHQVPLARHDAGRRAAAVVLKKDRRDARVVHAGAAGGGDISWQRR